MALDFAARLAAFGVGLSALELVAVRGQFQPEGVFSLDAVAPFRTRIMVLRTVDRATPWLIGVQAVAAFTLVAVGPFSHLGRLALALTVLSMLLVRWRRYAGGDGAEQMAVVVLIATGLAVIPVPSEQRVLAAVLFVAAQVCLAYITSGVAKLVSPMWRDGSALPAVLSTEGHGHPWAASILTRHAELARFMSRGVIFFECAFVVLILGPQWLTLTMLAIGIGFHIGCAVLMGLNSFVWSFIATYPCVLVGSLLARDLLLSAYP